MTALWTEACLAFPTLDALREGFEIYPVVDAVGGTSLAAHRAALDRVEQAGIIFITVYGARWTANAQWVFLIVQ